MISTYMVIFYNFLNDTFLSIKLHEFYIDAQINPADFI